MLLNARIPGLRGAVMTVVANGIVDLRWKNGTTFRFQGALVGGFGISVLTSITDTNGNIISLLRDFSQSARITETVDPVGRKLTFTYDDEDRIMSIVGPIGRSVQYTYDAQGALETVTDPEGGITSYEYDAENRLTKVTDARGVVLAQNTYGANGRVKEQVQADGGKLIFDYVLMNPDVENSPVLETQLTDPLEAVEKP